MAIKKTENGEELWLNRNGKYIPKRNIEDKAIRRDAMVEDVISRMDDLSARMSKEKLLIFNKAIKYVDYLKRKYKVEDKSVDGNLVLSNYANTAKVELKLNKMIVFDEGLNVAKTKIDQLLIKWSKKSNVNLRAIINEAFNVDKKGQVNRYMILGLLNLKINNKDWNDAMELIRKSMQVDGTRQYITLKKRQDKDSKWQSINLNFSSL